jgi:hypothetical protein
MRVMAERALDVQSEVGNQLPVTHETHETHVSACIGAEVAGRPEKSATRSPSRRGRWRYDVFGLTISSDISLPVTGRQEHAEGPSRVDHPSAPIPLEVAYLVTGTANEAPPPDGVLVASLPCALHGLDMTVHRGVSGARIWHRGVGTCHVHPDARRVDIYPEPDTDERLLGLLLAGQVTVFVLHQLGLPTLHASAAVTERGAVAFLGPKGQGKSTMVAAFLHRGATLLTDDVLPLRVEPSGAFGSPSLPIMKLWQQTVDGTLGLSETLPELMANYEKKLLRLEGRYAFATDAAPLRAFYLLNRFDAAAAGTTEVTSRRLAGRDAIAAIRSQLSPGAFLSVAEEARLLPFYARLVSLAPVSILNFPTGFLNQQAVYEYVMQDVAALASGALPAPSSTPPVVPARTSTDGERGQRRCGA